MEWGQLTGNNDETTGQLIWNYESRLLIDYCALPLGTKECGPRFPCVPSSVNAVRVSMVNLEQA